jgi:hypothetical protein
VVLWLQVESQHVHYELSAAKFSWDHPRVYSSASRLTAVTTVTDPYQACKDAHAICLLTGASMPAVPAPTGGQ